MEFEIRKFDPLTTSQEEWKSYHEFRKKRHMELTPEDPVNPDHMIETARKQETMDDQQYVERYFVYNSKNLSEIIGSLLIGTLTEKNPSYKGNEGLSQIDIGLLPEFRHKGIGLKLFDKALEIVKNLEKTFILANTEEKSGKAFLEKLGFSTGLSSQENRLYFNKVDWDMVKEWENIGAKNNPKTRIMYFDRIPDDIIESFARRYTEIGNQTPRGTLTIDKIVFTPESLRKREKEFENIGIIPSNAITLEENGDISGLTELYYSKNTKKILIQNLTGVKEEHRGRGLGKWLKAALLLKMKTRYPEVIAVKTGNADSNAPMLSINKRLGFELYKEIITAQIKLEDAVLNLEKILLVNSMVSA